MAVIQMSYVHFGQPKLGFIYILPRAFTTKAIVRRSLFTVLIFLVYYFDHTLQEEFLVFDVPFQLIFYLCYIHRHIQKMIIKIQDYNNLLKFFVRIFNAWRVLGKN